MSSGCIYIFGYVVFDENVFSFSELHKNVGVQLSAEINLLPNSLLDPPPLSRSSATAHPNMANSSNNLPVHQYSPSAGGKCDFMQANPGADLGVDPPASTYARSGESASSSMPAPDIPAESPVATAPFVQPGAMHSHGQ